MHVDALILRDRDSNGDGTLDERLYVAQDANYNVTALFDNTGNVVERYAHDPFGQVTVLDASWNVLAASAFAWVYLHQGGRFDATSELYHFRFRDYSPTLGRWTSLDPIRYAAGDVNLYRVVFNAPTVFTDPTGESIFGKVFVKIVQITKHGLKVIARNVGFDDAVRAVCEGEDVLAPTRKMAHDIAKEAGGGRPPIHDKPHGPRHDGHRPHYHAAGRPKGFGHVFYNIAGALTFSYWAEGQGTVIEWCAAGMDLVNPLSLPKDIMDFGYEITNW